MDFFQPLMGQLPPEARAWASLTLLVVLAGIVVWMYWGKIRLSRNL